MFSLTVSGVLVLIGLSLSSIAFGADLPIIDAHSQIDREVSSEQVLNKLDEAGVSMVLLGTRGRDVEPRVVALSKQHPDRVGALLSSKWDNYGDESVFLAGWRQREGSHSWVGLAEFLVTHAPHHHAHLKFPGLWLSLSSDQVREGLRTARKLSVPLILHIEFRDLKPEQASDYMASLERLLPDNRDVNVALIHMGQLEHDQARRLISAHQNLYFLTSHADPIAEASIKVMKSRGEIAQQGWINLFRGRSFRSEWRQLFVDRPSRFILAFDNVFAIHWQGELYPRRVALWRRALLELPTAVAHKIAHGNAERLWRLLPAKVR
jgi:predicted TIM-barrel fold metal-dependent hydrolase